MAVKNNIKRIRTENHILQADLADAIECDRKTISRYENGDRSPSLEIALRIARYFKIGMEDLFELEEGEGAGL